MKSPFPSLPYAYTALEPTISASALQLHHLVHHRHHHERTAELTSKMPTTAAMTLEDIAVHAARMNPSGALFHEASEAWNHAFFWQSMRPQGGGRPFGCIGEAIDEGFGSYPQFTRAFIGAALSVLSCGWLWLVWDRGRARLLTTSDNESPLLSDVVPLIALDLWEHAYYADFQDRRVGYARSFLTNLVNWEFASQRLVKEVLVALPGGDSRANKPARPRDHRGAGPGHLRLV